MCVEFYRQHCLCSPVSYCRLVSPGCKHRDGAKSTRGLGVTNTCGRKEEGSRTGQGEPLDPSKGSTSTMWIFKQSFSIELQKWRGPWRLPCPAIECGHPWEEHALGYHHVPQAEGLPKNILTFLKKLRQTLKDLIAGGSQLTTVFAAEQRTGVLTDTSPCLPLELCSL